MRDRICVLVSVVQRGIPTRVSNIQDSLKEIDYMHKAVIVSALIGAFLLSLFLSVIFFFSFASISSSSFAF